MVLHSGDIIAWTSDLADGSTALALFNVGESPVIVTSSFEAYNLEDALYRVKDAWTGKNLGKLKSVQNLPLEPHASLLWVLRK